MLTHAMECWKVMFSVISVYGHVTAEWSSLTRLTNDASRHQFLVQMLKAKVSKVSRRLVSKTDNVMHFARLVKQASVDLVSRPICLFGAYRQGGQHWSCPIPTYPPEDPHLTCLNLFAWDPITMGSVQICSLCIHLWYSYYFSVHNQG